MSQRNIILPAVAAVALAFLVGYFLGARAPGGTPATSVSPSPAASVADTGAGPRIRLVEESFDFGTVAQGEKVVHVFKFRNEGNGPLEIAEVTTSCGCTATILSRRTLAPGEEGQVQAEFDSTKYADRMDIRINLFTNDPRNQVVTAVLQGTVDASLRVAPAELELGPVKAGGELRGSFRVFSSEGHGGFRVVGLRASSAAVTVGPARKVDPLAGKEDMAYEIPVVVRAQPPYGALWDLVTVQTDHPRRQNVELKVTRTVVAP